MEFRRKIPSFTVRKALLEVTKGRQALKTWFDARPVHGPCPNDMRIHVVIMGHIEDRHSAEDDGVMEFSVAVDSFMIPDSMYECEGRPFAEFLEVLQAAPEVYVNCPSLGDYVKVEKSVVMDRIDSIFENNLDEEIMPAFFVDEAGNVRIE